MASKVCQECPELGGNRPTEFAIWQQWKEEEFQAQRWEISGTVQAPITFLLKCRYAATLVLMRVWALPLF